MSYLIDTEAFIWYVEGTGLLPLRVRDIIDDSQNEVLISKASLWEMAIKISLGKLRLSIEFYELEDFIERHSFSVLDYVFRHLNSLISLPFHHRDPFDRLIIAQAKTDNIPVITSDSVFQQYGILVVW